MAYAVRHTAGPAAGPADGLRGQAWRAAEVAGAAGALVVLLPLLAVIAVAILLEDRGPVLFVQSRIGRDGRTFPMVKFRTMSGAAAPAAGAPLVQRPDDPRTTRVGRVLRGRHLDELPQLLSVVAGHMSLVGPRPLVPGEDALVAARWVARHDHRPGLTGLWQLHRSPQTTVDELIRLDQRYLAQRSAWHDLRLIASTGRSFFGRAGR
jgi:lipopolysaccharide/colanic/teichoic acid biosynthesis glycosyltransferase